MNLMNKLGEILLITDKIKTNKKQQCGKSATSLKCILLFLLKAEGVSWIL